MPYEIIWEDQGIVYRHWGHGHPAERAAFNAEFYGDPRSDNCKYIIVDYTGMTDHQFGDQDIYVAAGYDIGASRSIPDVRVAVAVTTPRVRTACEAYRDIMLRSTTSWEVIVLASVNEARSWLGHR